MRKVVDKQIGLTEYEAFMSGSDHGEALDGLLNKGFSPEDQALSPGRPVFKVDQQAIAEVKLMIKEISVDIEKMQRSPGTETLIKERQQDKDRLMRYLDEASHAGRPRLDPKSATGRARTSVGNNIKNAFKQLRVGRMTALADYLEEHIEGVTSTRVRYVGDIEFLT